MKNWKKALRFALCLMPIGLIGGWFAAEMTLASVAPDALETAVQQVGSLAAVKVVTAVSSTVFTVLCGFFGYILAEKISLIRPLRFQKATLIRVLLISALGGAILSLDAWTFANWIPQLKDMRSINQQIREAESTFRLAGAGVENFEKTVAGTEAKLSMLGNKLTQQNRAVEQYSRALVAAKKGPRIAVPWSFSCDC